MMKNVAAGLICFALLYGIDALCFGGRYLSVANQALEEAYALNWH